MSTRCVFHRLLNKFGVILLYFFAFFAFKPERIDGLDCRMVFWVLATFKGDLRGGWLLIVLDRLFWCGLSLAIDAPLEETKGMGIYLARDMRSMELTAEISCP